MPRARPLQALVDGIARATPTKAAHLPTDGPSEIAWVAGPSGGVGVVVPPDCREANFEAEEVGVGDTCPEVPPGGFTPIIEWEYTESGKGCLSMPVVVDLDGDERP